MIKCHLKVFCLMTWACTCSVCGGRYRLKHNKYVTSEFRPRPEKRSVLDVVLEGGGRSPLLHGLLLQDGHAADEAEQEPDEQRGRHAQVLWPLHHRRGREPETRPLQDLSEIVGVSAVGPQSAPDELPLQERKIKHYSQRARALMQFKGCKTSDGLTHSIIWVTLEKPFLLVSYSLSGEAQAPHSPADIIPRSKRHISLLGVQHEGGKERSKYPQGWGRTRRKN